LILAPWLLLGQAEEKVPQWELIRLILAVAVVFSVGAAIIFAVNRWLKRPVHDKLSASDQLAQFRTLYERGQLNPEEFEKIRALLMERMKQELQMPVANPVASAASEEGKVEEGPRPNPPDPDRSPS
jgi:hypothetical protein